MGFIRVTRSMPAAPEPPKPDPKPIIDGRTEAWKKILESGTYHMKFKTPIEGGKEMVTEYFFKDNMWTTLTGASGMSIRSIQRDKKVYNVIDEQRTVMVSPVTGSSYEEPKHGVMIAAGSGTAQFNGKNLPYDEYSIKGVSDFKLQLFVDGNKLAGIRNIMGKTTLDQIILVLDQNVPNSVFEIPAGYKKIDVNKMMADIKAGNMDVAKELAGLMDKKK